MYRFKIKAQGVLISEQTKASKNSTGEHRAAKKPLVQAVQRFKPFKSLKALGSENPPDPQLWMLSTIPVFHLQLLTTFYDCTEPFKQLDGGRWRKYATAK